MNASQRRYLLSYLPLLFGIAVNISIVVPSCFPLALESQNISSEIIEHEIGYAFRVPLQEKEGIVFHTRFNEWDSPTRLHTTLLEDGTLLDSPAAPLRVVREQGHGAHTSWGAVLLFSASDNSDPRTNGRTYTLSYPLFVTHNLRWAMIALDLFALLLWLVLIGPESRRRVLRKLLVTVHALREHPKTPQWIDRILILAIVGAAVAVSAAILSETKWVPALFPDTLSYLAWHVSRTPGYPLFLIGLGAFVEDARWIVPIQLSLLLGALAILGWEFGRLFRSRLLAMSFIVSGFITTPVLGVSWFMLTESLYVTCVCLHLAAACRLFRTHSYKAAALAGALAGAAIAVRPAGYSLIVGLSLLAILVTEKKRQFLVTAFGGFALLFIVMVGIQYGRHGILSLQSFGGFSLAGYVAPLVIEAPPRSSDISRRITQRIGPLAQEIPPSSSLASHALRSDELFDQILYEDLMPEIFVYVKEQHPSLSPAAAWQRGNAIAMTFAQEIILANPLSYGLHSLSHYWKLWDQFVAPFGSLREGIRAFHRSTLQLLQHNEARIHDSKLLIKREWYELDSNNATPDGRVGATWWLDAAWDHNPYFSPWTLKAVCIGSILMLSGLLWATRLSSEGKFVVYAAFSIQTNMGYLALVQPAHYRYVIPLMPLVIVFTIGMAAMTWLWAYRQLLVPIQPHLRSCHPESVAISPRKEAQLHAAISSAIDTEDYSHAGNVRKSGQSLT